MIVSHNIVSHPEKCCRLPGCCACSYDEAILFMQYENVYTNECQGLCHWIGLVASFICVHLYCTCPHTLFAVTRRCAQAPELIMQHSVHVIACIVIVKKACLDYSCHFSRWNTSKQHSSVNCTTSYARSMRWTRHVCMHAPKCFECWSMSQLAFAQEICISS